MASGTGTHARSKGAGSEVAAPVSGRTLVYIPIIHTRADMGALGDSLARIKASTLGRQRLERSTELIEKMWQEIERTVERMPVWWRNTSWRTRLCTPARRAARGRAPERGAARLPGLEVSPERRSGFRLRY